MKKLILLASLLGLSACHMPPQTEPRPTTRIIYIYETSPYRYGYGYNSRYDDCWMRGSSNDFYCSGFRYLPRVYIPMYPQRDGRIDLPRQPEPQRRAVPRAGPPGVPPAQRPPIPRVNPPERPELPHRMIPREQPSQQIPQQQIQPPRDEPRTAEPRKPEPSPRKPY